MSDRPASRREFLAGSANRGTRGEMITPETATAGQGVYHLHVSRQAMACNWEAIVNAGQHAAATEAAVAALDLVEALEAQLTVYRESSEIMQLNRLAARDWIVVEPRLFALLQLADEVHRETAGAYDVATGALIEVWGFLRRQGRVPDNDELSEALARTGMQHVQFDGDRCAVRFDRAGVAINLGSIGKGYALDRCREVFADHDVQDYLLQGGRSSVTASGDDLSEGAGQGWTVGIGDPLRPGQRLGAVRLLNQALSTSGAGTQFFRHQGRRYGHILDPRTGRPAEGVLSTTVVADSAALAEALSTAFYVLGPEAAQHYCETHRDVAAVVTLPGGGPQGLQVRAWNFGAGRLVLAEPWRSALAAQA
ncbi:MAG: FAD:protein FMN transferase [Pirellulales bacterium]|nr:FAD:protein FMN transferase [Pirellulales bacterium]